MPAKPSPWHAALEESLEAAGFGLPLGYELRWHPLPPFDDWIVHISGSGHDAAVLITAHQMTMSENLISLVNDNAAGRLIKIIATPNSREIESELIERLEKSSIHLLRYEI